MNIGWTRVGGIAGKELAEYRRGGSVVSTMAIIPLMFILPPMIQIFTAAPGALASGDRLLYILGIPAIAPAVIAALVPALAVSYLVYGLVLAVVGLFAQPDVSSALLRGDEIMAQVIFTPLVVGWSIWAGMAISTRVRDARVAQQLGALVSLPVFAVAALTAYGVIRPTLGLALGLGAALVALDVAGWRITSVLFDRERLITGSKVR
jgi:hypothetical protein